MIKAAPDINDTLREYGDDEVRARHDRAFARAKDEATNGNGPDPPFRFAEEELRNEKKKPLGFELIPFNQVQFMTTPTYVVKDVIPDTGIVIVWGPPKCGKSFWTFDVSMHIARGLKYRGHRVRQGAVIYCAFEGQKGFSKRIQAYRIEHEIDREENIPFFLSMSPAQLVRDHKKLIASIKAQLGETIPVVISLDTLNRSIDGSESKDEDMGAYLSAADAIHFTARGRHRRA